MFYSIPVAKLTLKLTAVLVANIYNILFDSKRFKPQSLHRRDKSPASEHRCLLEEDAAVIRTANTDGRQSTWPVHRTRVPSQHEHMIPTRRRFLLTVCIHTSSRNLPILYCIRPIATGSDNPSCHSSSRVGFNIPPNTS